MLLDDAHEFMDAVRVGRFVFQPKEYVESQRGNTNTRWASIFRRGALWKCDEGGLVRWSPDSL